MKLAAFDDPAPATIEDAARLLADGESTARAMAGGQGLTPRHWYAKADGRNVS